MLSATVLDGQLRELRDFVEPNRGSRVGGEVEQLQGTD